MACGFKEKFDWKVCPLENLNKMIEENALPENLTKPSGWMPISKLVIEQKADSIINPSMPEKEWEEAAKKLCRFDSDNGTLTFLNVALGDDNRIKDLLTIIALRDLFQIKLPLPSEAYNELRGKLFES